MDIIHFSTLHWTNPGLHFPVHNMQACSMDRYNMILCKECIVCEGLSDSDNNTCTVFSFKSHVTCTFVSFIHNIHTCGRVGTVMISYHTLIDVCIYTRFKLLIRIVSYMIQGTASYIPVQFPFSSICVPSLQMQLYVPLVLIHLECGGQMFML